MTLVKDFGLMTRHVALGILFAVCGSAAGPAVAWGLESSATLDIQPLPDGGAAARATLILAGPLDTVHAILTDYENWPSLFPPGLRLASIRREPHRVVTEIYVPRHMLAGELRLVAASHEPEPGTLEMTLIEGDFSRYRRTWRLIPADDGATTRATLELEFQPNQWVPHWLLAIFLRKDLEEHFSRLQTAVAARATR